MTTRAIVMILFCAVSIPALANQSIELASSFVCRSPIGQIEIIRQDSQPWNWARNTATAVGNAPVALVKMNIDKSAGANFLGSDLTFLANLNMGQAIDFFDTAGSKHHKQAVLEIESIESLDSGNSITLEFGTESLDVSFYMSTVENSINNCVVR